MDHSMGVGDGRDAPQGLTKVEQETGLREEPRGRIMARGMLVGAAAGLLYGVMTDNIAIGVTMGPGAGVGIAAVIRAVRERKRKK